MTTGGTVSGNFVSTGPLQVGYFYFTNTLYAADTESRPISPGSTFQSAYFLLPSQTRSATVQTLGNTMGYMAARATVRPSIKEEFGPMALLESGAKVLTKVFLGPITLLSGCSDDNDTPACGKIVENCLKCFGDCQPNEYGDILCCDSGAKLVCRDNDSRTTCYCECPQTDFEPWDK